MTEDNIAGLVERLRGADAGNYDLVCDEAPDALERMAEQIKLLGDNSGHLLKRISEADAQIRREFKKLREAHDTIAALRTEIAMADALIERLKHLQRKSWETAEIRRLREALEFYTKPPLTAKDDGAVWGECPKNRLLRTPDGVPGLNYLCPGLMRFFAHEAPEAKRIAARLQANRRVL